MPYQYGPVMTVRTFLGQDVSGEKKETGGSGGGAVAQEVDSCCSCSGSSSRMTDQIVAFFVVWIVFHGFVFSACIASLDTINNPGNYRKAHHSNYTVVLTTDCDTSVRWLTGSVGFEVAVLFLIARSAVWQARSPPLWFHRGVHSGLNAACGLLTVVFMFLLIWHVVVFPDGPCQASLDDADLSTTHLILATFLLVLVESLLVFVYLVVSTICIMREYAF